MWGCGISQIPGNARPGPPRVRAAHHLRHWNRVHKHASGLLSLRLVTILSGDDPYNQVVSRRGDTDIQQRVGTYRRDFRQLLVRAELYHELDPPSVPRKAGEVVKTQLLFELRKRDADPAS